MTEKQKAAIEVAAKHLCAARFALSEAVLQVQQALETRQNAFVAAEEASRAFDLACSVLVKSAAA